MKQAQPPEIKMCPECGADCPPAAARCWMCHCDIRREAILVMAEASDAVERPPAFAPAEWFFAVATWVSLVLVGLVGVGLGAQYPGLAVAYAILVVPALVGAWVRIKSREARAGNVSWAEKFATLAVSGAIMAGVIGLTIMALIVAGFVFCVVALSGAYS